MLGGGGMRGWHHGTKHEFLKIWNISKNIFKTNNWWMWQGRGWHHDIKDKIFEIWNINENIFTKIDGGGGGGGWHHGIKIKKN